LPTAQKYNNNGSGNKYQIITAWEMFPTSSTNNETSFTNILDDLNGSSCGNNTCIQLGAGASGPEPMDIGLGLVINSTNFVNNFRTTAAKYIIMLTDAPPSGPDDAFTEADYNQVLVYAATCVFRGIKVFVLGVGVNSNITIDGTARYPWRELATQTGGTWDITYDTTDVEADITVACDNDGTFTPYKFSAWYGYDKDCAGNITSFNSSTVQTSESNACAATINQTYYHNGSASAPAVGDECYINQNQTTVLAADYYLTSSGGGFRITGTAGTVASLFTCTTLTEFYATSTTNKFSVNVCGISVTLQLWHDGSGLIPLNGDSVYTSSAGTTLATWVGYRGFRDVSGSNSIGAAKSLSGVISDTTIC
jgi:hypothetical protein